MAQVCRRSSRATRSSVGDGRPRSRRTPMFQQNSKCLQAMILSRLLPQNPTMLRLELLQGSYAIIGGLRLQRPTRAACTQQENLTAEGQSSARAAFRECVATGVAALRLACFSHLSRRLRAGLTSCRRCAAGLTVFFPFLFHRKLAAAVATQYLRPRGIRSSLVANYGLLITSC